MPMVMKRKTDSGVASTKQSPKKPEEGIPVGNRNTRPSQQLLVKI